MRTPGFWYRPAGTAATLLRPAAALYALGHRRRFGSVAPTRVDAPVICIGNLTSGGAGKTPTVLDLVRRLRRRDRSVAVLSRGYGGRTRGPHRVDPDRDDAGSVGDEPLLLALAAPTWVGGDRVASALAALAEGADVLVMDDGFQNPGLAKDLSIVAVYGDVGFGNGLVIPAGPLREPVEEGLARADAVAIVGEDRHGIAAIAEAAGRPVLMAEIEPDARARELRGAPAVLFAGVGHPEKFFRTAEAVGLQVVARFSFADHHRYTPDELMELADLANRSRAELFTTVKDYMRLTPDQRLMVKVIGITIVWRHPERLDALLDRALARRGVGGRP